MQKQNEVKYFVMNENEVVELREYGGGCKNNNFGELIVKITSSARTYDPIIRFTRLFIRFEKINGKWKNSAISQETNESGWADIGKTFTKSGQLDDYRKIKQPPIFNLNR